MIADSWQKVKVRLDFSTADLLTATIIFLTSLASFGLGRLSATWPKKEPLILTQPAGLETEKIPQESQLQGAALITEPLPAPAAQTNAKGKYVASKSGSAYHFPWCPGALKIKEENKIWFQTTEEARAKGYKAAANCPDL